MGPRLPAGGSRDDVRHAGRPGLERHLQVSDRVSAFANAETGAATVLFGFKA
jgi:hypothetical protein